MSSTVYSYGFIAVLLNPIDNDDEREELHERLYDDASDLGIGYKGQLVYLDYNQNKPYREREDYYGLRIEGTSTKKIDPRDIVREAEKYGLLVDESTIRSYDCIWYDGGDCPVWMISKTKYLKQIQG